MHSVFTPKNVLIGVAVVGIAAACVPPVVSTVASGACAACSVFDSKTAAPTAGRAITSRTRAVDAVALAAELAAYGRRTNSALSLLNAAELLIQASPTALSGKDGGRGASKSGAVTLDPAALISSALAMSPGNSTVSTFANQLQARLNASKGALGGPQSTTDVVLSNATDTWRINFRGGERGSIRVRGDTDSDLDCYVYNSAGTLLDYDNDYTDYCILDWYQGSTGTVRLEIRNLGVANMYVLTTN